MKKKPTLTTTSLSSAESSILEADIVLETLDNDVVSMEVFFKAWLHNSETDQENIHLLLTPQSLPPPSRAKDHPSTRPSNHSTQEVKAGEAGVQGHLQLHSKSKVNLGCKKS